MRPTFLANIRSQPDTNRALRNYSRLASTYDASCHRIEGLRLMAVDALGLQPGETVLDVACGTGPTLPTLALQVAQDGLVVGIELSPNMALQAQHRVSNAGLGNNVRVLECAVESMPLVRPADALLLCYTHDVLQSPPALDRLIDCAKPGARIVILGMKTLPWLLGWPVNAFNLYRARKYLTTYLNMDQPWRMLEARGAHLRVTHTALWGSAYIAVGTLPSSPSPVVKSDGSFAPTATRFFSNCSQPSLKGNS